MKVAIVGAGVSGLYMARLLLAKGYAVTVFEAKSRIGGRIKMGTVDGHAIDLGGHWIHKTDASEPLNSLLSAIDQSQEPYLIDDDDTYITKMANGDRKVLHSPLIVIEFIQHLKNIDLKADQPLLKTMMEFSDSKVLYDFINSSVADYGSSCNVFSTLKFKELISSEGAEHHELANKTMSEFIYEYFSTIPKESILLSTPVLAVEYEHHKVNIITEKDRFQFNKVIISVPVSQLKNNKIRFSPPLPERKLSAFQKIGMGDGVKMFLFFKSSILPGVTFNRKFAPYYIQKKMGAQYVVISLIMGEFMNAYTENKEEHIKCILNELSEISGKNADLLLENSIFYNWTEEPFIEGTYSYPVSGIGSARKEASEPVQDTIFFIGEAMNTESDHASINGAMDTSYRLSLKF